MLKLLVRFGIVVAVIIVGACLSRVAHAQSWSDSYSRASVTPVRLLLELKDDGGVHASSACMAFSDDGGSAAQWVASADLTGTSQTSALNALNGPATRMCINQSPRGAAGDAGLP